MEERAGQDDRRGGRWQRRRWQRIVLWVLFAVLGGACLWMWWAMGKIQEAMDRGL